MSNNQNQNNPGHAVIPAPMRAADVGNVLDLGPYADMITFFANRETDFASSGQMVWDNRDTLVSLGMKSSHTIRALWFRIAEHGKGSFDYISNSSLLNCLMVIMAQKNLERLRASLPGLIDSGILQGESVQTMDWLMDNHLVMWPNEEVLVGGGENLQIATVHLDSAFPSLSTMVHVLVHTGDPWTTFLSAPCAMQIKVTQAVLDEIQPVDRLRWESYHTTRHLAGRGPHALGEFHQDIWGTRCADRYPLVTTRGGIFRRQDWVAGEYTRDMIVSWVTDLRHSFQQIGANNPAQAAAGGGNGN